MIVPASGAGVNWTQAVVFEMPVSTRVVELTKAAFAAGRTNTPSTGPLTAVTERHSTCSVQAF